MTDDIIYFELNSKMEGFYPSNEQLNEWIRKWQFSDDEWCKNNKLCVLTVEYEYCFHIIWCITSTRSWVQANFPELLTDKEYTYSISERKYVKPILVGGLQRSFRTDVVEYKIKYSDMIRYPNDNGDVFSSNKRKFLKYSEENFGSKKIEEIIYFEINNWFAGRDYPYEDPFKQWVKDAKFEDVEWCKNNKLCVKYGNVDMSVSWCVGATRSWVMEHCPNLLSDGEYTYDLIHCGSDGSEVRKSYPRKYSDFLCHCDEDGTYYSRIDGWKLPEYCEENFGAVHTDEYWTNLENEMEDEYDEEDVNPEFARTPESPEALFNKDIDEEYFEDVNPESSQSQESSDNLDINATLWQRIRKFLHI